VEIVRAGRESRGFQSPNLALEPRDPRFTLTNRLFPPRNLDFGQFFTFAKRLFSSCNLDLGPFLTLSYSGFSLVEHRFQFGNRCLQRRYPRFPLQQQFATLGNF
jgi:hypothetical protein